VLVHVYEGGAPSPFVVRVFESVKVRQRFGQGWRLDGDPSRALAFRPARNGSSGLRGVTRSTQALAVLWIVGVQSHFDQVLAFVREVVSHSGAAGEALYADGVAGEYLVAEGSVAFGGVWVAVGSSCPVGGGPTVGAASGVGVE